MATLASVRKALTPAVLAAVALAVQWIESSHFDSAEWRTVAAGAVTALVVYLVPND